MSYPIQNLITHNEFGEYFAEACVARSNLVKSGIAKIDPVIAELCKTAIGSFVELPFFKSILATNTVEATVLTNNTTLTPEQIAAGQDRAPIFFRGKAFGTNDVDNMIAGKDPMKALGDGLADYWNAERQTRLIKILAGIFGTSGVLTSHQVTGTEFDPDLLLDAAATLGDRKTNIVAYAMNTTTETAFLKTFASSLYRPSDTPFTLSTFNGKAVVVDDAISDGEIYLFGEGSVAINPCACDNAFEAFRDPLSSSSGIVTRDASIVHVRGVKYKADTANPGNSVLATPATWERVWESKFINVAQVKITAS